MPIASPAQTDVVVPDNGAGTLLLSFFDWGYRTPRPAGAGTKRRLEREKAQRAARATLYASTPSNAELSRQVRRRAALLARKSKVSA